MTTNRQTEPSTGSPESDGSEPHSRQTINPPLKLVDWRVGLTLYLISSAIVLLALWFGRELVTHSPLWDDERDYWGTACSYDGGWYQAIINEGYSYRPNDPSNVAFFPAYPLLAKIIVELTGCRTVYAMLLVSHLFLAGAFVLFHAYLRQRFPNEPQQAFASLLMFSLVPTTFFFRLGYTESMFVFLCVLMLFGNVRNWHPFWLAVIAGFATATRAPGVALGLVLAHSLWQSSPTWGQFTRRLLGYGTLSCWGISAFVIFQALAFNQPFGFAKTQEYWNTHTGQTTTGYVVSLVTFEPLWNTYNPGSSRYWKTVDHTLSGIVSLHAANPIYFALGCVAVLWGWWKRWLNTPEVLLAIGLLLIPYVTRAYFNSMSSFGRFSAVVVPAYIVYGRWVQMLFWGRNEFACFVCGFWLIVYAALFGAAWWLL